MPAAAKSGSRPRLRFRPLTPERWPDVEKLFSERGACGGCWCMWWRLRRAEFERQKGGGNKRAFRKLVESGPEPGLLAYAGGEPVAWCAVAPREEYPVLERSRVLGRVDAQPVWSLVCLFVARPFRNRGITRQLLKAAAKYAAGKGAHILEGYPVEPRTGRMADAFAWTGFASAFRQEGFREVARRSKTRPMMRLALRRQQTETKG